MCENTHLYVRRDWFIRVTWLIPCPSSVRHYPPWPSNTEYAKTLILHTTWLIYIRLIFPPPVLYDIIHCDLATQNVQKHWSYVRRDWFMCIHDLFFPPTALYDNIHRDLATRNMQKHWSYVGRDWFMCIHDLCLPPTALYDIIHRDLATRNVLVYSYSQHLNRDVEVKLT